MARLSKLYDVKLNLRGVEKQGYCRPTVTDFFNAENDYNFAWCTRQPVTDNLGAFIYDNSNDLVFVAL